MEAQAPPSQPATARLVGTGEAEYARRIEATGRFMADTASTLRALLVGARALHAALQETQEYGRAHELGAVCGGEAEANKLPAYDLAGTLNVLFEEDAERMVVYLEKGARRARRALRRPATGARGSTRPQGPPAAARGRRTRPRARARR